MCGEIYWSKKGKQTPSPCFNSGLSCMFDPVNDLPLKCNSKMPKCAINSFKRKVSFTHVLVYFYYHVPAVRSNGLALPAPTRPDSDKVKIMYKHP
jgi:hypothetical protein